MSQFLPETQRHRISPYLFMQFFEPLGTSDSSVDAAWDYLHDRWQPDFVQKYIELAPPMLRFGGCFASYYHWYEGVGPRSERKTMLNLCWDGLYSNQVGTGELVELCRMGHSEPLFVVNMESDGRMRWAYPKPGENRFGTASEAAAWVRYCNDPDDPLRKAHGSAPFHVKYWQIGNETSFDPDGYGLDRSIETTNRFAREMLTADPSVRLIAWGDSGWAKRMSIETDERIRYIAFHHHFNSGLPDTPLNGNDFRRDPEKTWVHLMNAHLQLRDVLAQHRDEIAGSGKRLAMTEGHFMLKGRNRCEVLSMYAAGVAYARCIIELEKASDILDIATMADFAGNRWQVNAMMLPTPTYFGKPYYQPVGLVMKLFSHHIGTVAGEEISIPGVDSFLSFSKDGKKAYLHLVNPDPDHEVPISVTFRTSVARTTAYELFSDNVFEEMAEPELFCEKESVRTVSLAEYRLPKAGVAALEIEFEPASCKSSSSCYGIV